MNICCLISLDVIGLDELLLTCGESLNFNSTFDKYIYLKKSGDIFSTYYYLHDTLMGRKAENHPDTGKGINYRPPLQHHLPLNEGKYQLYMKQLEVLSACR